MSDPWVFQLLSREHARDDYDCGESSLNNFLQAHARKNAQKNVSKTYVAVIPPERVVLGYYSVCAGSFDFNYLPEEAQKGLPRYPVPAFHLARLAVDKKSHGLGLGGQLLMDALRLSRQLAEIVGICAVTVDALSESAKSFYQAHGFEPLLDDPFHLYMMMESVQQLDL